MTTMRTRVIHDFRRSVAKGEDPRDEPFWEAAYRRMFPNFLRFERTERGNTQEQRNGIDRVAYLSSGLIQRTDEKKRSQVYRTPLGELDICLEYISNDQTQSEGWMEKDLCIDYIVYCWWPIRQVDFLPWCPLRRAWILHKDQWIRAYPYVESANEGYNTISAAVPREKIWAAMADACSIQLSTEFPPADKVN